MTTIQVNLKTAQAINKFVEIIKKYAFRGYLKSGKFIANATIPLEIFSLDLSRPLTLEIDADNCEALLLALKEFIAVIPFPNTSDAN